MKVTNFGSNKFINVLISDFYINTDFFLDDL